MPLILSRVRRGGARREVGRIGTGCPAARPGWSASRRFLLLSPVAGRWRL